MPGLTTWPSCFGSQHAFSPCNNLLIFFMTVDVFSLLVFKGR